MNHRILVISPSGNLYGSENVLLEYLRHTKLAGFRVAVPYRSNLMKELLKNYPGYNIETFTNSRLWVFYLNILYQLLTGKLHSIYCNEGGHIKYFLLISRLFRKRRFIVHIRILEDTDPSRWIMKPGRSLTIISISGWLQCKLPDDSKLIYDPFEFGIHKNRNPAFEGGLFKVGVIGRITTTKGLLRLIQLAELIYRDGRDKQFQFRLFGDVSPDARDSEWFNKLSSFDCIKIVGFELDKDKIYNSIDAVLHISTQEALGRIVFEAVDYQIPFVGMNAAGIGEVCRILGNEDCLADPEKGPEDILRILDFVRENYKLISDRMDNIKLQAAVKFDPLKYAESIDKLLLP